jgi:hypothetical protein
MPARFFVVDSGGTSRQVARMFVVDSGGTSRLVTRAFVVDSGGTSRQFFAVGVVSIDNFNLDVGPGNPGANQSATYQLNLNGNIEQIATNAAGTPITTVVGQWITPTSQAANYECMFSAPSGTFSSGTFGSWQALTSTRGVVVSDNVGGGVSGSCTLEIRRGSGSVEDTATISLSATKDP